MQSFKKACFKFDYQRNVSSHLHFLSFRSKAHFEHSVPERCVTIYTCGNLYKNWKEQNLYSKVPEGDLKFDVSYIDTRPNNLQKSTKTILALHGAPGSWKEFLSLACFLHERGCRVIAPSFPDFSIYKPGIFRHSDVEKAQYIKDFLSAISVKNLDLLVCHSSAVYPALRLCLEKEPVIKSLALLNPGTFNQKEMSSTKHSTFLNFFMKAGENPISLKFLETYGPFILKNIINIKVKFESVLDPLLSATAMMRSNIPESKQKFQSVAQKMPIFFVFSENDPLINTNPSYELAELLGASSSDIFIYDKDGHLVQKGTVNPRLKVLAMKKGSHYAFLKYPELINQEIADFLKLEVKN